MCCLSLLCCSRLKSNRDHKRPYISPTHSILESLTWSTYIHHQSSSYIPCILLIFFCIDHPWSFVRDPGLMGCGTDQEPGDTKVTAAKLQSFRCTVSYCILLYLTVSYCILLSRFWRILPIFDVLEATLPGCSAVAPISKASGMNGPGPLRT